MHLDIVYVLQPWQEEGEQQPLFVFAGIVAATDPVAVVAPFNEGDNERVDSDAPPPARADARSAR